MRFRSDFYGSLISILSFLCFSSGAYAQGFKWEAIFQVEDPCSPKIRNFTEDLKKNKYSDLVQGYNSAQALANLEDKIFEHKRKLQVTLAYDSKCVRGLREYFYALRYVEDFIVAQWAKQEKKVEKLATFKGVGPYNEQSFEFNRSGIQCGDIIIRNFGTVVSMGIAQSFTVPSQFSHTGFVSNLPGKKERPGLYIVEATPYYGAWPRKFNKAIGDPFLRSLALRFRNTKLQDLACSASNCIAAEMRGYYAKNQKVPKFNFSIDPSNHEGYFCSQVVAGGYQCLSAKLNCQRNSKTSDCKLLKGKELSFLLNPQSTFLPGMIKSLTRFGVSDPKNLITFAPGDFEVDPALIPVAEWRDFKAIDELIFKDIILRAMYLRLQIKDEDWSFSLRSKLMAKIVSSVKDRPFWRNLLESIVGEEIPFVNETQATNAIQIGAIYDKIRSQINDRITEGKLSYSELETLVNQVLYSDSLDSSFTK